MVLPADTGRRGEGPAAVLEADAWAAALLDEAVRLEREGRIAEAAERYQASSRPPMGRSH